jgi:hypothetical protein
MMAEGLVVYIVKTVMVLVVQMGLTGLQTLEVVAVVVSC